MYRRLFLPFLLPALVQGQILCRFFSIHCGDEQQAEAEGAGDSAAPIVGNNAGDRFGWSTALSNDGNTLAVGSTAGPVRVLQHDGERWNKVGAEISSALPGDLFGYSIDLSGDGTTVAIGAPAQADDNVVDASLSENEGRVGVFRFDGSNWVLLGSPIRGEGAGDRFGASIALSEDGTILAVGAPINDGSSSIAFTSNGHVRVFQWTGLDWQQLGSDIDGESFFDRFGTSVALSADGKALAVGAPLNDANNVYEQGHVRVYFFDGTDWFQRGQDIDGGIVGGQFGSAVALSDTGTTVAAISRQSGVARIFSYTGSDWFQLGTDASFAGTSIDMSGDGRMIAIGSEGRVRVLGFSGAGEWEQIGSDLENTDDGFGWSVSLSQDGDTLTVGSPFDNDERGRVRVFELN